MAKRQANYPCRLNVKITQADMDYINELGISKSTYVRELIEKDIKKHNANIIAKYGYDIINNQ